MYLLISSLSKSTFPKPSRGGAFTYDNWRCSHTESHRVSTFWLHVYRLRGMCAYRCALRPALRTVSRLALRGCYKIGSSNFEPLARSYRPANRRTFTAGRYPVAGNYSLIHVLLRCVLTLWPCARPAGQSGKVRKQMPVFPSRQIMSSRSAVFFVLTRPHAGFASRSPCVLSVTQGLPEVTPHCH